MFEFQQDNDAQESKQHFDQNINRGLALLVLITVSTVGSSWFFSLPVYFDIKIAAQILPVLFSIVLLFLVTKIQNAYLNKLAPLLGYVFVFCCWSYVIFLNSSSNVSTKTNNGAEVMQNILDAQHLGMSNAMYLIGLCFIILWLGKYFKYSLYLSLVFIVSLILILQLFTNTEVIHLLAPLLLLVSSAVFSMGELSVASPVALEAAPRYIQDSVQEVNPGSLDDEFLLPSELSDQELKPELDINVLPLNESHITHDWELILRELHGELKNTTDVDELFKSMLLFLHGAMEFDAAAVGMLQDKSIKRIAAFGDDEYLHTQALNWTNQRVKELFALREPILSTQSNLSAATDNVTEPMHRLDVPVISNQKVVGLVTFFRDELLFDTHDVKLAASIVFHSMIALRQARLQDEIKRLTSNTKQTKLTLYSREQFVNKVKFVFEKLSRPRECSLFIVEIDNLDSVIDTQGRDAGALLFKATSKVIMSNLTEHDVLGRYGNEGFVILLDETDLINAKAVAEKIRLKASQIKLKFQNKVITTTISIGLTIIPDADEGLPSIMRKADMGLFVAKENGSNSVKVSL